MDRKKPTQRDAWAVVDKHGHMRYSAQRHAPLLLAVITAGESPGAQVLLARRGLGTLHASSSPYEVKEKNLHKPALILTFPDLHPGSTNDFNGLR